MTRKPSRSVLLNRVMGEEGALAPSVTQSLAPAAGHLEP
jgi:hypothetical protein